MSLFKAAYFLRKYTKPEISLRLCIYFSFFAAKSKNGLVIGAGNGNRTRLCGLGSDRSTDELCLRFMSLHIMFHSYKNVKRFAAKEFPF